VKASCTMASSNLEKIAMQMLSIARGDTLQQVITVRAIV
jgi:hypothetical protein